MSAIKCCTCNKAGASVMLQWLGAEGAPKPLCVACFDVAWNEALETGRLVTLSAPPSDEQDDA